MGVWAHPDDESFMTGGLMALAAANGQTVVCITATRGEAGVRDKSKWPADKLQEIRTKEAEAALEILGVTYHRWLDYADGSCHLVPENEAVGRVQKLIETYRPDTLFTFPPDGLTGHWDHQAVSLWTCLATEKSAVKKPPNIYFGVDTKENYDEFMRELNEKINVYFNVDEPALVNEDDCDLRVILTKPAVEQKIKALLAMPSQTEGMKQMFEDSRFMRVFGREQFVKAERTDLTWNKPYWQS